VTDSKLRKDNRELAIARAEEAAKHHGLVMEWHNYDSPWIIMYGWSIGNVVVVEVKERGWKNASDAFVAAVNEWALEQRGRSAVQASRTRGAE